MDSNFDKNKLKGHLSQDSFNPGVIVGEIRDLVSRLRNTTDQIVHSNGSRISDNRGKICQDLLNAFETTLFAFHHNPTMIGKLTNGQQREILVMIDDILRGKREYAHFQLTRNGDGIKELFSEKVFQVNNQTNDKDK